MALTFERRGAGPILVLLHPLGADRRIWAPVIDRLAAERDVIAIDLPGFGGSPPLNGSGPPTPAAIARAVAACLDEIAPDQPVHVAGNSLGGWVALELAATWRARTVTAIAPAGLWAHPLAPKRGIARKVTRALLPVLPVALRFRAARRFALGFSVRNAATMPPAAAMGVLRAYALAPDFEQVNAQMRAGVFGGLEDINIPVTLAWPQFDRLIARPAHLPASVHNVTLAGCGHLAMWDDPDAVADVLLAGSA